MQQFTFSIADVTAIIPELIVGISACLLLMVDLFLKEERKEIVGWLAIIAVICAGVGTICLASVEARTVMAGMYVVDLYSALFKIILYIGAIFTLLLSLNYIKGEGLESRGEYYALILFALTGMMCITSGADLLTIYLGIELMALPIYVLVGYMKKSPASNEAAMKYIILGAFSSGILLYGVSLLYGYTGTTNLSGIAAGITASGADSPVLTFGVLLLTVGLCFKVAGFPFHMWAPDAYEGAPTSITAFMTVGAKAAAFAGALRIFIEALQPAFADWQAILIVVAVGSMFYGNITAIMQTNIKRMLAYSSIGHAGYAFLGLIAGTPDGAASIIFYMFVYTFMNLGAFGVIILLRKSTGKGNMIDDYKGLAKDNRLVAVVMLIIMFSLAGIPPTAGFMGKFYIFMALIDQGMITLAVISIVSTAIAAFFYIRIVLLMYMKEPEGEFDLVKSFPVYYVLAICVMAVIVLGVYPGAFMHLAKVAAIIM